MTYQKTVHFDGTVLVDGSPLGFATVSLDFFRSARATWADGRIQAEPSDLNAALMAGRFRLRLSSGTEIEMLIDTIAGPSGTALVKCSGDVPGL